ncbi:DUF4229 domain-containing protein [Herbidospora sp. NBRC 101105]|uniref:DUF4229 domain-containing protein n=1 Tax=Herbidospora sp. NBRC 101105 TaxID=3032195 RepID=UPI0024A45254|nr:DUF4229 domain-containing protein [Herbidospora sp. NBRC 101105]GLX96238.1 hypothetical protein Hesp01_41880 [Herbidospora sp. NBRC 101105]
MHPVIVYTVSRVALFAASFGVLYLLGLRTFVLFVAAFLVSGLASYVLLSKQRDAVSEKISEKRGQPEG